jgi:hypothetical protein
MLAPKKVGQTFLGKLEKLENSRMTQLQLSYFTLRKASGKYRSDTKEGSETKE